MSEPFDGCPLDIEENNETDDIEKTNENEEIKLNDTIDASISNDGNIVEGMDNLIVNDVIKVPDYSGKILFVERGKCTFLTKAQYALSTNATAMIVVNNEDRIDSPSSGLGVDRSITYDMVKTINEKLSILSISNISIAKISHSLKLFRNKPLFMQIVPLVCGVGGSCIPSIDEEKKIQAEVTGGEIKIKNNDDDIGSFEFLTSNFGGVLSDESFSIIVPNDQDGCEQFTDITYHYNISNRNEDITDVGDEINNMSMNGYYKDNYAIMVDRGNCGFDVKALNVQNAGAQLMIVVDIDDNALQRMVSCEETGIYVYQYLSVFT
jgi:hypothetical protein